MSYAIETVDLSKDFPVHKKYRDVFLSPFRKKTVRALHKVSLQVNEGEIFGLLGPNGAGKTTLMKILCTLVLPDAGSAFIKGVDVTRDGRRVRQLIGYVISEERSFYWRLSGRQNLKFFAKLNNIPNRDADLRIAYLLDFLDLTRDADRMFKDYSLGMRQKLAIARGLLADPAVILMDEAVNGLDPVSARNLKTLVREKLAGEEKKTVVFATHNLRDAEELCSRIIIINNGEVIHTGTMEDLRMKFTTTKSYVLGLKNAGAGLLAGLRAAAIVKGVVPVPEGPPGLVRLEVELGDGDIGLSRLIREVVEGGAEVSSLHEKEPALEDLFEKMVRAQ